MEQPQNLLFSDAAKQQDPFDGVDLSKVGKISRPEPPKETLELKMYIQIKTLAKTGYFPIDRFEDEFLNSEYEEQERNFIRENEGYMHDAKNYSDYLSGLYKIENEKCYGYNPKTHTIKEISGYFEILSEGLADSPKTLAKLLSQ